MECAFPACKRKSEANGLCVSHKIYVGIIANTKVIEPDKPKPIANNSEKEKQRLKEYYKIVKEMLATDERCDLRTPECTGLAEGLHHMKGRGIMLLVRKYLKRACNACNGYVERHPKYAIEHGLSISKLSKDGSVQQEPVV